MLPRTYRICSGNCLDETLNGLGKLFMNSGFPSKFVDKYMAEFRGIYAKTGMVFGPKPRDVFPFCVLESEYREISSRDKCDLEKVSSR